MNWETIDLKDAPESLQNRVQEKLNMHDGSCELLQVVKTEMTFTAYLSTGNLCTVLTVWFYDQERVNEDSMTVGEINMFMNHPSMKVWFS